MPSDPRAQAPIRVLLAKPGLDGHFRGVATVGVALRNAGMEVIYTGPRQTPDMIAGAAIAEDVDVIGLNIMTVSAAQVVERVLQALADADAADKFGIVVGGIVKPADAAWLRERGISGVFGPGTPMADIVHHVRELALRRADGA